MFLGLSMSDQDITNMKHLTIMAEFVLKLRDKLRDINISLQSNYSIKIGQSSRDGSYYMSTCNA